MNTNFKDLLSKQSKPYNFTSQYFSSPVFLSNNSCFIKVSDCGYCVPTGFLASSAAILKSIHYKQPSRLIENKNLMKPLLCIHTTGNHQLEGENPSTLASYYWPSSWYPTYPLVPQPSSTSPSITYLHTSTLMFIRLLLPSTQSHFFLPPFHILEDSFSSIILLQKSPSTLTSMS